MNYLQTRRSYFQALVGVFGKGETILELLANVSSVETKTHTNHHQFKSIFTVEFTRQIYFHEFPWTSKNIAYPLTEVKSQYLLPNQVKVIILEERGRDNSCLKKSLSQGNRKNMRNIR